jgi:hypothetical protein
MTTGLAGGGDGVVGVVLGVVVAVGVVGAVGVVDTVVLDAVVVVVVVVAVVVRAVVDPVAVDVLPGAAVDVVVVALVGVGVPVRSSARAAGVVAASAPTTIAAATALTARVLSMRMVLMGSPGVLTAPVSAAVRGESARSRASLWQEDRALARGAGQLPGSRLTVRICSARPTGPCSS